MIIGHVLPDKETSLLDAYEKCRSLADPKVCCDYALHMGITWWAPKVSLAVPRRGCRAREQLLQPGLIPGPADPIICLLGWAEPPRCLLSCPDPGSAGQGVPVGLSPLLGRGRGCCSMEGTGTPGPSLGGDCTLWCDPQGGGGGGWPCSAPGPRPMARSAPVIPAGAAGAGSGPAERPRPLGGQGGRGGMGRERVPPGTHPSPPGMRPGQLAATRRAKYPLLPAQRLSLPGPPRGAGTNPASHVPEDKVSVPAPRRGRAVGPMAARAPWSRRAPPTPC